MTLYQILSIYSQAYFGLSFTDNSILVFKHFTITKLLDGVIEQIINNIIVMTTEGHQNISWLKYDLKGYSPIFPYISLHAMKK